MDDQTLQEPDTLPWSGLSERSVSEVVKPTKSALRLKIKVPKANDFCGEESFDNQSCGTENRVCKFCKKGFSSGKALGGHMRVHAQDDDILGKNQNSKLKVHHPLAPANNGNYKASNATNNPTCSLCGKSFPSMKSLFGHMRCHPEREWRGIQPPPPAAKNSSSSTVSDSEAPMKIDDQNDSPTTTGSSAFNLTESLPRWSVTAKRGRKSIAPASSEEQKIDAIYNLVMLAHGIFMDSARSVSDKKRISELSEATSSRYFPSKKLMVEDRDHVSENLDLCKKRESGESQSGNRELQSKKLKIDERRLVKRRNEELETRNIDFISNKVNANKGIDVSVTKFDPEPVNMDSTWDYCIDGFGEDSKQSREDESDSKTTDDIPVKQITCMMKKRKKKMKLRYLETVGDMDLVHYKQMPITTTFSDKYYCSTCNKSFSSHQALGGHKSSHKKDNNSLPIIADMDVSAAADASAEEEQYGVAVNQTQVDGLGEFDDARSRVAISTHRCKICNKTFPTGQALGGHKRCHWTGPVEAPSSSVASLGEVSKIGRAVLDFDLNEVPVMEEEGLESGCTQSTGIRQPADYASSSYKSVA